MYNITDEITRGFHSGGLFLFQQMIALVSKSKRILTFSKIRNS